MSETDRDNLKVRLSDFSRRLETQTREFAAHGELSDQDQSLMTEIQHRRDRIQTKPESVEASGTAWDVIKFEIERELRSLSDKLALFDEKLDAIEMKQRTSELAYGGVADLFPAPELMRSLCSDFRLRLEAHADTSFGIQER